jgi:hypothetical protein
VSYRSTADFVKLVFTGDGRPLAALQEENAPREIAAASDRQIAPARDYELGVNDTSFTIDAPRGGTVVLGEAFESDNFQVTVNGHPTPYFRVNHAFKGVTLDGPGVYRIVFRYWPKVLTPALWLSALGLALLAATLVWVGRSIRARPSLAE